jgi:hypothetical protein
LCREKKFVVFSTDIALQAHIAKTHAKNNKIEVMSSRQTLCCMLIAKFDSMLLGEFLLQQRTGQGQRGGIGRQLVIVVVVIDVDVDESAVVRGRDGDELSASARVRFRAATSQRCTQCVLLRPLRTVYNIDLLNYCAAVNSIRGALDETQFAAFRSDSAALRRGDIAPSAYYAKLCAFFAPPSAPAAAAVNGVRICLSSHRV